LALASKDYRPIKSKIQICAFGWLQLNLRDTRDQRYDHYLRRCLLIFGGKKMAFTDVTLSPFQIRMMRNGHSNIANEARSSSSGFPASTKNGDAGQ
jgi:hypothetical protein